MIASRLQNISLMITLLFLSIGCAKPTKMTKPLGNVQVKTVPPHQPVSTDPAGSTVMTNVLLSDQLISILSNDVSPTGNKYQDPNSCVQWVQDQQGDMLYFEAGIAGCVLESPPLPDPTIVKFKLTFATQDGGQNFTLLGSDGSQVGSANWAGQSFVIQSLCEQEMLNCQLLIDGNGSWQGIVSTVTGQSLSY